MESHLLFKMKIDGAPRRFDIFPGGLSDLFSAFEEKKIKFSNDDNLLFCPASCHYTPGNPDKPKGEQFQHTRWLSFDLDKIEPGQDDIEARCERAFEAILKPTGERHYVWSGHGIQAHFRISKQGKQWFSGANTERYRAVCVEISRELDADGIAYKELDTKIFEPTRLLRVPWTMNVKPDMTPANSFIIESLGEEGKENPYIETLFSQTMAIKEPNTRKVEAANVKEFFEKIGAKNRGTYWLMNCPFCGGNDKKPSFAFYSDIQVGIDFHKDKNQEGYIRTFFEIWQKHTGKDFAEFKKWAGLERYRPISEVIGRYFLEEYKAEFLNKKGVYFEKFDRIRPFSDFKDLPDQKILQIIDAQAEEMAPLIAARPRAPRMDHAYSLYKKFYRAGFFWLEGKIPFRPELADFTKSREEAIQQIVGILCKRYTVRIDLMTRNEYVKKNILKAAAETTSKRWVYLSECAAFVRNRDGETPEIAINFWTITALESPWARNFTNSRAFAKYIQKRIDAEPKIIRLNKKAHQVLVIPREIYEDEIEKILIEKSGEEEALSLEAE